MDGYSPEDSSPGGRGTLATNCTVSAEQPQPGRPQPGCTAMTAGGTGRSGPARAAYRKGRRRQEGQTRTGGRTRHAGHRLRDTGCGTQVAPHSRLCGLAADVSGCPADAHGAPDAAWLTADRHRPESGGCGAAAALSEQTRRDATDRRDRPGMDRTLPPRPASGAMQNRPCVPARLNGRDRPCGGRNGLCTQAGPMQDRMRRGSARGTGSSGTGQECTAGAQVRTQAARRQAAVTPDQTFFCGACAGAVRAQTTHGRPGADGMQTRHRPCAGSSGTGQNGQAAWQQTRRSRIRRSPGRSVPDQTERVRPEPKQPASARSEPDQTEPGRNAGCRNGASCRWILSGSVPGSTHRKRTSGHGARPSEGACRTAAPCGQAAAGRQIFLGT